MLLIALSLLLLSALACFGLSRFVPTRRLGQGAASASVLAGILLLIRPDAVPEPAATLLTIGAASFQINTALPTIERGIALALLGGGAVALLTLAAAIAASVRGFGAIFGWGLLAVLAALLGLAAPPLSLLQPLAWSAGAIAGYGAIWASGALARSEAPPQGLLLGLLGSALLGGALVGAGPALAAGELPHPALAACMLLAVLAVGGLAPLHSARSEATMAPAPLGALIYGLVLPGLGLGWLLRATPLLPVVPAPWATLLGVIGLLGALGSAGGALGERRLRPLLVWLAGGQAGLILIAAGLSDPQAALAGPALLLNMMLASAAGAAAIEPLERGAGTDDYTSPAPGPRLPFAGLLWAGAAAALLGLPPFLGFWGQLWLLGGVAALLPWATPLLLTAGALRMLAALAPLPRYWAPPRPDLAGTPPGPIDLIAGSATLAVPLILGVAPQLAWDPWLRATPFAPVVLPTTDGQQVAALVGAALAALAIGLVARAPSARSLPADPDEEPARLAPDALALVARPLAALGRPDGLLRAAWFALSRISLGLRYVVAIFEQRYYLLAVLMVLMIMMLLMAQ